MTRDELIEKVAIAICESRRDEFNWWDNSGQAVFALERK